MRQLLTFAIVAVFLFSATGCAMWDAGRDAAYKTSRLFVPNGRDYDTNWDDTPGEWEFVGEEGRRGQEREVDPDPWYKKWLQSDKAREIEKNLGVD